MPRNLFIYLVPILVIGLTVATLKMNWETSSLMWALLPPAILMGGILVVAMRFCIADQEG